MRFPLKEFTASLKKNGEMTQRKLKSYFSVLYQGRIIQIYCFQTGVFKMERKRGANCLHYMQVFTRHLNMECFELAVPATNFVSYAPSFFIPEYIYSTYKNAYESSINFQLFYMPAFLPNLRLMRPLSFPLYNFSVFYLIVSIH